MTTFTDVFERKEVKYRLNASQHDAMIAALAGRMAPDAFGTTRIVSRYLDTPDRALIERSLDKPLYKEKLRLRGYGAPEADDRVFIEIKKKYKGIVYKRRVGCSLRAACAYLNGMPYEQACARYPLPDPVMAAESLAPRSVQIAREIDVFAARHAPLRPSVLITCDRTAYAPISDVADALDASDDLRITFDANIAYCDLFEAQQSAPRPLLQAGDGVMEIKAAGPFPLWLVHALDACAAYPSSFSKYGAAYRACAARGERAVAASTRVPAAARPRHANAEAKAERLAAAVRDDRPRHFRAPNHAVKKGGRCA